MNQAAVVCRDDELGAVACAEFHEQAADVCLGCGQGDIQPGCDLGVGQAEPDEGQNLAFSSGYPSGSDADCLSGAGWRVNSAMSRLLTPGVAAEPGRFHCYPPVPADVLRRRLITLCSRVAHLREYPGPGVMGAGVIRVHSYGKHGHDIGFRR